MRTSEDKGRTLGEVAALIRSKNAGPFMLTIDIMFADRATYDLVKADPVMDPQTFSDIYGVASDEIQFFHSDAALAVKVSFPRPWVSGSRQDRDVYGGQIHAPLVTLPLRGLTTPPQRERPRGQAARGNR